MALNASTRSMVLAPRASLSDCVRAYVLRSTLGAALVGSERHNHFPASAACSITWFIEGSSQRVASQQPLPDPIAFRGPHTKPITTCNPGPAQMFVLLLMPDALQAMTGIRASQHLNQLSAAYTVFTAPWLPLLRAVAAATDDTVRVQLIEAFLDPRWRSARTEGWALACSTTPWAKALASRAALAAAGRSSRQLERRVRARSGLPMRTLKGLV
jgi:hypothetical protein